MSDGLKITGAALLFLLLIFIGTRVYGFVVQEHELSADLAGVQAELTKAQTDATSLQEESQYLANPINLEKELRARFNYKEPGETMIIIVPAATSTASSTL
jgi:cell division protein FtsB